jgi:hypothetical protein
MFKSLADLLKETPEQMSFLNRSFICLFLCLKAGWVVAREKDFEHLLQKKIWMNLESDFRRKCPRLMTDGRESDDGGCEIQ